MPGRVAIGSTYLKWAEYNSVRDLLTCKFLLDATDGQRSELPMRAFIWDWPKKLAILIRAKASTTIDLCSQVIDASKLNAQRDTALAIRNNAAAFRQFTGEELQVKFLPDSGENSLKY